MGLGGSLKALARPSWWLISPLRSKRKKQICNSKVTLFIPRPTVTTFLQINLMMEGSMETKMKKASSET